MGDLIHFTDKELKYFQLQNLIKERERCRCKNDIKREDNIKIKEAVIEQITSEIENILETYPNIDEDKKLEIMIDIKRSIDINKGIIKINDIKIDNMEMLLDNDFDKETFSEEDLIMVHATKYLPDENRQVKTLQENGVKLILDDNEASEDYQGPIYHRNTLHSALNGLVGSHMNGNWESCPIIIIEPLKHHMDNVMNVAGQDTYTWGGIQLSKDAKILVSSEFYNSLENKNQLNGYDVILFDGDSKEAVDKLLVCMGYKPQSILSDRWRNENNSETLRNFIDIYNEKNDRNIKHGAHFGTIETQNEDFANSRDLSLYLFRKKMNNPNNNFKKISSKELEMLINKELTEDHYKEIYLDNFRKYLIWLGISYDFEHNEIIILDDYSTIKRANSFSIDHEIFDKLYEIYNLQIEENKKIEQQKKEEEEKKQHAELILKLLNMECHNFYELNKTNPEYGAFINTEVVTFEYGDLFLEYCFGKPGVSFDENGINICYLIDDERLIEFVTSNALLEKKDYGFSYPVKAQQGEKLIDVLHRAEDVHRKIKQMLDAEYLKQNNQKVEISGKTL